jgi:hypothetical protein
MGMASAAALSRETETRPYKKCIFESSVGYVFLEVDVAS